MQIYLVGGAVRDALLGLAVTERDWVVVGATPEQMMVLGYQPVGKEFPVFLHPQTHEEYALARTERKVGRGYKGFVFYTSPHVTLEEDLRRRDLTVNAMAQTLTGEIIDPYGGRVDVEHRILRHVSPAFQEDPLRVLRVARLAAKLPGFTVHPSTNHLMQQIVVANELQDLVAERVWQELVRAMSMRQASRFWDVLHDCGADQVLFPEFQWSIHKRKILEAAISLSPDSPVRLAALFFDMQLPHLQRFCQRYHVPVVYRDLMLLVAKWHVTLQNITTATAEQILALLLALDGMRRPERCEQFLLACQACDPEHSVFTPQCDYLKRALVIIQSIDTTTLQAQGLTGQDFAAALEQLRLNAIKERLLGV